MGRTTPLQTPKLGTLLKTLGENIHLARRRRKLTAVMVAERAGITRMTLRAIENGEPQVSFGAYANVLFSLGLEKDISQIARDDELGRRLQDAELIASRTRTSK